MKTLFVHERFGAFGGAEANIGFTAAELRRRGHGVGLLHGPATGQGEPAWRETFSPCYPLRDDGNRGVVQTALWECQPELIYVHKMADLEVLETLVASGLPLVRMVHDHDLYCMRSYKYMPLTRRICRRPFSLSCLFPCGAFLRRNRGADLPFRWVSYRAKRKELQLSRRFHRVLVATQYMKDELVRNGFAAEKIELHPPMTDSGEAPFTSSFSDRNLILFVGQVIRGKGVDVLLESLARVATPFRCYIFGEGNHRAYCERLSRRLGLADRVHFKGFVPQEELRSFYRECSLVVLSSVWPEPFGAAGLEGMRYGLPVVAFDAGGIREWLADGYNGYLVPWMDRNRFAARVEDLLVNKTLAREMGERARHFVLQGHNREKYIAGLEQTFAEVVAETGAVKSNERSD